MNHKNDDDDLSKKELIFWWSVTITAIALAILAGQVLAAFVMR
jgi:hypothetical protein